MLLSRRVIPGLLSRRVIPGFHLMVQVVCAALLIAAFALASTSAAEAHSSPRQTVPDSIVAVVAGNTLTQSEFMRWYTRSGAQSTEADETAAMPGESSSATVPESPQDFLRRYVNFRLKVTAAEDADLDTLASIQQELARYREQIARPALMKAEVLDPIIREIYARQAEEIEVSHILIRVDETASPADTLAAYREMERIVDTLDQGAPFAEVARTQSEDPSAKRESGPGADGRLGAMTSGQLVEPFEDVMYATAPGERSEIFRTQYGYHVLNVHDRRPRPNPIRIAHILIRPDAPSDTLAARSTADSIRSLAVNGEGRFDALARTESDDPRSAQRGGELGVLRPGQNVPPAFRDAAFEIDDVGDVSDVVRTQFGYHILKLLERQNRPSLETAYASIEERVQQMPRMKRRMAAVANEILARENVSVDTTAILAAAYPKAGRSALDSLARPLARLTQDTNTDAVIATFGDLQQTREDLAAFLQSDQEARQLPIRDALTRFVNDAALNLAANDLERTDPSFRRKMKEYRDGLLLFEYMQRKVWTPAAQDSAALRSLFENRRDAYRFPERIRTIRLLAPSDSLLAPYNDLSAADVMDRAASDSVVTIDTLFVTKDSPSPQNRIVQADNGASVGPVASGGQRALFVRVQAEAPRRMTFEEARSRVIRDYQDRYEQQILKDVRSRYHVETYPSNLPDPSQ